MLTVADAALLVVLGALLVLLPGAVFALVWRLMNSTGRLEWKIRTNEPERAPATADPKAEQD